MRKSILPAIILAAALALGAVPGHAQTPNANGLGGIGMSQTVTVRARSAPST